MRIKVVQKLIDKIRGKKKKVVLNTLLQSITKQVLELKYIHIPAVKTHTCVFSKYKGMYKGRTIVILGSGPTLRFYNMLKNAVHIGVNHTFTIDQLKLDYLFVQDNLGIGDAENPDMQHRANVYRGKVCKKFYGTHYCDARITEQDVLEANAERYYFLDHNIPTSDYAFLTADITTRPLNEWSSVIFAAMEFALWTHPEKIYIVGCDCTSNGHIYVKEKRGWCAFEDRFKYGWKQIKRYRDSHYSDVRIISINPVGLTGLFEDVYTQNYVDTHSDLKEKNIEILEEEIKNAKQ